MNQLKLSNMIEFYNKELETSYLIYIIQIYIRAKSIKDMDLCTLKLFMNWWS